MDWGIGAYERTAETLRDASRRIVRTAEIGRGMRVLDLGCGTGNAALEAAGRGAEVVAVDPARRLLDVCSARAAEAGLAVTVRDGDASGIPAEDGTFDVLLSVFGVIFAQDADRAAAEMLRVTRKGGRIVFTSWNPTGPIFEAGVILLQAMSRARPEPEARPMPAWGDPTFLEELFARHGATAAVEDATLGFRAASPSAWLEDQERHHPIWLTVRAALEGSPGAWEDARPLMLDALQRGNEDPAGFLTTSAYRVVTVTRPQG